MTCRIFRRTEQLVDTAGLELVSLRQSRGNHLKLRVRSADGREENYFFAHTASDVRTERNQLSQLKRFAHGRSTKVERTS